MTKEEFLYFHKNALVFDIHIHGQDFVTDPFRFVFGKILKKAVPPYFPLSSLKDGAVDGGGLCAVGDLPWARFNGGYMNMTLRHIKLMKRMVKSVGGKIVSNEAAVWLAKQDKILSYILGVEGANPLENNPENVVRLHKLGVRMMTIVHLKDNAVGTVTVEIERYWGSGRRRTKARGLTAFGEKVVKKMNAVGMIVDLAHADYETVMDVVLLTKRPVIVSHSGAYALSGFHRHMSDDEIIAVASTGGVIGLWPMYFSGKGMAGLADFTAHLKHILKLTGEDHIAVGTDMNGVMGYMDGYKGIPDMPTIVKNLFEAGLNERQVQKILGLNFMRVLKEQNMTAQYWNHF